jgi:hypothetical protein
MLAAGWVTAVTAQPSFDCLSTDRWRLLIHRSKVTGHCTGPGVCVWGGELDVVERWLPWCVSRGPLFEVNQGWVAGVWIRGRCCRLLYCPWLE